uniref:Paraneoplastic antigen Ma-like C-terminal domain-containing protein n=1 Tax=Denticeps clupeoides TaxID=299321 RepID=A0AAY4EZJ0_9TELE
MQRRKILESLLPPASDLIRQLGPDAAPCDYVKLLESAYGLVEDGEEIFAKFLSTHQNTGERASEYLQRLQVLISTAIRRGGIAKADANRQLMRQFQRGCWDQSLILTLQLGCKPEAPDFSDFLLQLRTEEDRRATKQDRMQRHFRGLSIASLSLPKAVSPLSSPDAHVKKGASAQSPS